MHAISPLRPTDQLPVKGATKRYPQSYIRCYTCRRKSIESKLTGHLIFGEAECTLCNLNVIACRTFHEETTNSSNRVCNHRFEFNKPFDHLYDEFSQNIKRKSDEAQAIAVANGLATYLSKLGRLEGQEPWMSAILRSREKVKEIRLRGTAPPKELNNNNENIPGGYASTHSGDAYSTPFRENGMSVLPIKLYRVRNCESPECSGAKGSPAESLYCIAGGESAKEPRVRKPLRETQSSSAPTLPPETSSTSAPQATPHETLPAAGSAPPRNEIVVTGFLNTPADGYYYVSRRALEECPMCYAALCPSRFTVNVQTFLLTTVCIDCGLTIYLVFEPPDGSAPRVAIVTENQRLRMAQPRTKASGKEKSNKARRPFTMQWD